MIEQIKKLEKEIEEKKDQLSKIKQEYAEKVFKNNGLSFDKDYKLKDGVTVYPLSAIYTYGEILITLLKVKKNGERGLSSYDSYGIEIKRFLGLIESTMESLRDVK